MVKIIDHEAVHNAFSSNLLLPHIFMFKYSRRPVLPRGVRYIQNKTKQNKTKRKIVVLHILIFTFLDMRQEDERFWILFLQAFPEINLLLLSTWK
jgi:hypothetical protein